MEKCERIKPSEIRTFLLRYAAKKKIRIQEFVSDELSRPICFYAHLEIPPKDGTPRRTATALSNEGHDTALTKAFLYLSNSELDFLPES